MTLYNKRLLCRIVLEATTPLSIGSGLKDITTDSLVVKDINDLPYIPGTSIAGVLRHAISTELGDDLFGYQSKEDGEGSKLIITEARLVHANGKVLDGIISDDPSDAFLLRFKDLPIRQHTGITQYGTTKKGSKYDEQIVYKGTRFCFEMELCNPDNNTTAQDYKEKFEILIKELTSPTLRLGSGTRSGFGAIKIIPTSSFFIELDLQNDADLELYLSKSSSLADMEFWQKCNHLQLRNNSKNENWVTYTLTIKPEDFILFSSGFGDSKSDIAPVNEATIQWDANNHGHFIEHNILIPATSVKGALSHRVAFHYNKLNNCYIDNNMAKISEQNEAVLAIFGGTINTEQVKGNLIISDQIEPWNKENKILNHVSIDNFTGGAINGALFSEQVIFAPEQSFTFNISVNKKAFSDNLVQDALECALNDICTGMLPLGGGTNRGHGCFIGSYTKN